MVGFYLTDLHYKPGSPGDQTAYTVRTPISLWPQSVFSNLAAYQNPLGRFHSQVIANHSQDWKLVA